MNDCRQRLNLTVRDEHDAARFSGMHIMFETPSNFPSVLGRRRDGPMAKACVA